MKKGIAIFFICIQLFSLAGARLVMEYIQQDHRSRLQDKIDEGNYDMAELVEMKVPLSNPYYSSSPGYERYYGEFDQRGTYYSYVMRKVINDTVYLLCLPDRHTTQLKRTGNELLEATGDSKSLPTKELLAKKQVNPDYYSQDPVYLGICFLDVSPITKTVIFSEATLSGYMDPPLKPPATACVSKGHMI